MESIKRPSLPTEAARHGPATGGPGHGQPPDMRWPRTRHDPSSPTFPRATSAVRSTLPGLHTAHCTLHTAHCTLHTAHCMLHNARSTLHRAHCTLLTTCCTLFNARCTMHTSCCLLHAACCMLLAEQCPLLAAHIVRCITCCLMFDGCCRLHNSLLAGFYGSNTTTHGGDSRLGSGDQITDVSQPKCFSAVFLL